MKHWVVDVAYVSYSGIRNELTYPMVVAASITEAIEKITAQVIKDARQRHWLRWKIWNVGMVEQEVW